MVRVLSPTRVQILPLCCCLVLLAFAPGAVKAQSDDPFNCSCTACGAGGSGGDDGGSTELSDSDKDTLRNGKIGMIFATFVITMAGSLAPWGIVRLRRATEIMAICACFAAGVILGAGFSHLFPDAQEGFDDYWAATPSVTGKVTEYPWVPFIAVSVLLLLIYVDFTLIRGGMEGDSGHGHDGDGHQHHSHAVPNLPAGYQDPIPRAAVVSPSSAELAGVSPADSAVEVIKVGETGKDIDIGNMRTGGSIANGNGGGHSHDAQPGSKQANAQAWVFFVALAVHSVFDGLGVGATDTLDSFYALLVAVLAHKALDGFALGVPVLLAQWGRMQTAFALVFCALMTPLGVGIGMAATDGVNGTKGSLSKAIILSMSAGSFVFISLIELLPAGLRDGRNSNLKMLCLTFGWGIMALIANWV